MSVTLANGFEQLQFGKHGTGSHESIVDGSKTSVLLKNTAKKSIKQTKRFKRTTFEKIIAFRVKTQEFNKNLLHTAYAIFQLLKVRILSKNTSLERYESFTNFW